MEAGLVGGPGINTPHKCGLCVLLVRVESQQPKGCRAVYRSWQDAQIRLVLTIRHTLKIRVSWAPQRALGAKLLVAGTEEIRRVEAPVARGALILNGHVILR